MDKTQRIEDHVKTMSQPKELVSFLSNGWMREDKDNRHDDK